MWMVWHLAHILFVVSVRGMGAEDEDGRGLVGAVAWVVWHARESHCALAIPPASEVWQ
jgi:hypothetical protein